MSLIEHAERGRIPDTLIRAGIRRMLRARLIEERSDNVELAQARLMALLGELRQGPIAVQTAAANEQHYEVPAAFFIASLGRHLKYSSCWFSRGDENLDDAEAAMLDLTCRRADLRDGQDILELGCGWGSLSLWMAEKYPRSRVVGVSNSASQRAHIMARAAERGLGNLEIITCDINSFTLDRRFDRVVSVEMFEHMHNYQTLLARVAGWMRPDARLFVHIFTHHALAYKFAVEGEDNWMGRHFFTGGIMPSDNLLLHFQDHVAIDNMWVVSGRHYSRTANLWLVNLDRHQDRALATLATTYGADEARLWLQRWRIFFMACAELWGYNDGAEWRVCHYLFHRRTP